MLSLPGPGHPEGMLAGQKRKTSETHPRKHMGGVGAHLASLPSHVLQALHLAVKGPARARPQLRTLTMLTFVVSPAELPRPADLVALLLVLPLPMSAVSFR